MRQDTIMVVFGNQLFSPEYLARHRDAVIFMAEDVGLCTYVRHHQQKIVLFLAAMRSYAEELREAGFEVIYHRLDINDEASYEDRLRDAVRELGCRKLLHFEIEDKPVEQRVRILAKDLGMERTELRSPMFCTERSEFRAFAEGRRRLLMADFYRQQRISNGILVDEDGRPAGGKWSFDAENRKKLPKSVDPPAVSSAQHTSHVRDLIPLVATHFSSHPGSAESFWWPTTRDQAREWLGEFLEQRFSRFGPFEDAMSTRSATVFHSLLSPMLNIGLLTPQEVLDAALDYADTHEVPIESVEGFVRQILGWREFVRGVYQEHSEVQESTNFWGHNRELTPSWYEGTTGILPLDDTIRTSVRLGWAHHIPRLMVVGNLMTLCEVRPDAAWRWFMEMYVDSSDWVMGPNVFGMGIFSDGGLFATKPYICGSNYLRKMSDYQKSDWCEVVDGLYWRFIEKHRGFFAGNPRLALMPRALDRLEPDRKRRIFAAAEHFLDRNTG